MKIIPPARQPERSREGLLAFLRECRADAERSGGDVFASISLLVNHIDPLAVLESIYDPGELHFYLERSSREESIAGADGVAVRQTSGLGRFREVEAFREEILSRTTCIGDTDAPGAGPHFFCAFTFFEEPRDTRFAGATVFLPRWQVVRRGDVFTAVANLRIAADSPLEAMAEKVWRAHVKFSAFGYDGVPTEANDWRAGGERRETVPREVFTAGVREALEAISSGELEKVVLARCVDLSFRGGIHPLRALNRLRMTYPNCFTFSVANGTGQSFIGASPELLVRRRGDTVETEALAGSAPRGATASEDAVLAGDLLRSEKDSREHRLVIDSILRRLRAAGVEAEHVSRPRLLQLPNVQHLRTPVRGKLRGGVGLLDVLAQLHPTPAVGGTPREPAMAAIRRMEAFSRGLYAGAVGWIAPDGDGEFTVAIRSTLIDGGLARLYAGAGIVAGSDPEREWCETEVKMQAMLSAFSLPD